MAFTAADALLLVSAVILAFNLLLGLAGLGAPLMACVVEAIGLARSKVFYRKAARQISVMGLSAGIYLLIVLAGTVGLVASRQMVTLPDIPALIGPAGLGAFGLWLAASLVYVFTWNALKNAKVLHAIIGLAAAAGGLAGLTVTVAALLPLSLAPAEAASPQALNLVSLLAPCAVLAGVLALALAGVLGLVYILYRRSRDDWGRDYYAFALKLVAGWTVIGLALAMAGLAYLGQASLLPALTEIPRQLMLALGIGAGAGLLALILLAVVWKSSSPLRQKLLVALAAPLVWAFLSGLAYAALHLVFVA